MVSAGEPPAVDRAAAGYTAAAKVLHWGVAALVIAQAGSGLVMPRVGLPLAETVQLYQWHKSIGLVVLAAMLVRVAWRAGHAPPPLPEAVPPLQRRAAGAAHMALYVLLLAQPVTGWLLVSAAAVPFPTAMFGLFEVPHYGPLATLTFDQRQPWEAYFRTLHGITAAALAALVAVHLAAVLAHRVGGTHVLPRMLPAPRTGRDQAAGDDGR